MDNKQARKTGRTIMVCGCVLIVLTKVYLGAALIAVGLLFSLLLGRCPTLREDAHRHLPQAEPLPQVRRTIVRRAADHVRLEEAEIKETEEGGV